MSKMKSKFYKSILNSFVAVAIIFLSLTDLNAQNYTGSPVTKARLIKAVQSKQFAVPTLVKQIRLSGTDFDITPSVERELLAARANPQIISAVRENYRYRNQGVRKTTERRVTSERDIAGERYEELFYQGLEQLNQLRASTSVEQAGRISSNVIATGNQAVKSNPARPEAYTLIGATHLFMRNFAEAQKYGQQAIDRGGSLAFPVYHLSGTPHIETLHIGQGFVTVESNQKFFEFNGSEVSNPRQQDDYSLNGTRVAVFSMPTNKNGRSDLWYFAPGSTGTPQEANMIMQLIRKNSINSR